MKKQLVTGALVLAMALGAGALAGCAESSAPKDDLNANVPAGAPKLMSSSHEGRFDRLGANGCYGCHGANDKANPMLKDATAMPENHYLNGSYDTKQLDPGREQCNTCHVQG